MSEPILLAIARSRDSGWLKQALDFNKQKGNKAVVDAASARLRDLAFEAALRRQSAATDLASRVEEALRVYEALLSHRAGAPRRAGYTRRARTARGPIGMVAHIVMSGRATEGLGVLAEYERLDCSFEQIAIDCADELPSESREEIVAKAKKMLATVRQPMPEAKAGVEFIDANGGGAGLRLRREQT
jgi:hypothetical protein